MMQGKIFKHLTHPFQNRWCTHTRNFPMKDMIDWAPLPFIGSTKCLGFEPVSRTSSGIWSILASKPATLVLTRFVETQTPVAGIIYTLCWHKREGKREILAGKNQICLQDAFRCWTNKITCYNSVCSNHINNIHIWNDTWEYKQNEASPNLSMSSTLGQKCRYTKETGHRDGTHARIAYQKELICNAIFLILSTQRHVP
jgi:hypothetical protein